MMLSLLPHFLHFHSTLPFLWDGPSDNNELAKKYAALCQALIHSFIQTLCVVQGSGVESEKEALPAWGFPCSGTEKQRV